MDNANNVFDYHDFDFKELDVMMMRTIFLALFATFSVYVYGELSDFEQTLQSESSIETHESIEVHGGTKYRKLESKVGVFYFKFLSRSEDVSELDCKTDFNLKSPTLITMSAQVFKRSRAFMRTLKESCESDHGQRRFTLDWSKATEVGLQLPDSNAGVLKNKEIHLNPFIGSPNVGFSGSF